MYTRSTGVLLAPGRDEYHDDTVRRPAADWHAPEDPDEFPAEHRRVLLVPAGCLEYRTRKRLCSMAILPHRSTSVKSRRLTKWHTLWRVSFCLEFKLADLWIGAYPDVREQVTDIWVCLIPCLPIHIRIVKGHVIEADSYHWDKRKNSLEIRKR